MMKIRSLLLVICALWGIAAASMAETVREKRSISGSFKEISATSGIAVYFSQGSATSVEVEADSENISNIKTELKGGALEIRIKQEGVVSSAFRNKYRNIKVYVSSPEIEEVSISGGASFNADAIIASSFDLSQSGGARSNIASLKSSGEVSISLSGGANASLEALESSQCDFSSSGGAGIKANVNCSGKVSAAASGGARITVSGKSNSIDAAASGGASVNVIDLKYSNISSASSGGGRVRK